jgi:hypothetical protein
MKKIIIPILFSSVFFYASAALAAPISIQPNPATAPSAQTMTGGNTGDDILIFDDTIPDTGANYLYGCGNMQTTVLPVNFGDNFNNGDPAIVCGGGGAFQGTYTTLNGTKKIVVIDAPSGYINGCPLTVTSSTIYSIGNCESGSNSFEVISYDDYLVDAPDAIFIHIVYDFVYAILTFTVLGLIIYVVRDI